MTRRRLSLVLGLLVTIVVSSCDRNLSDQLSNLVQDPLGTEPFPVILGGDNSQVYYATNLGNITFRFPGFAYDSVLPGFLGPSNVYEFTKKPELIRPLTPAGAGGHGVAAQVVTDGRYLAYVSSIADGPTFLGDTIVVEDLWRLGPLDAQVVFDRGGRDDLALSSRLSLDSSRLAFAVRDLTNETSRIHVEDLTGADPSREIDVGEQVTSIDLRGNRLAYAVENAGQDRVMLRDLSTEVDTVLAEDARSLWSEVFLTANFVIWAESSTASEIARVMAWDVANGTLSVWSEGVEGDLVGATDDFFVTEDRIVKDLGPFSPGNDPDMFIVRRYDRDGKVHKLAEFRWTGLSGQTSVVGDRAVWVNPERKVVLAPLNGDDRIAFKPF